MGIRQNKKKYFLPIRTPVSIFTSPLQPHYSIVIREGVLYEKDLALYGTVVVEELKKAHSDAHVAVNQGLVNCLDEAVRSVSAMWIRCHKAR